LRFLPFLLSAGKTNGAMGVRKLNYEIIQ